MAAGDLISVPCRWGIFPYQHFGIDIGDGTVVHLATDGIVPGMASMSVRREPYDVFRNGKQVHVEAFDTTLSAQEIVERALGQVGKKEYHLIRGNCEHFARSCATQESTSIQVERVARSTVRVGLMSVAGCSAYTVLARSAVAGVLPLSWIRFATVGPILAGETARGGSYAIARACRMRHRPALRVGQSVGAITSAASGLAVGGPIGSLGALAAFIVVEKISGGVAKRIVCSQRSDAIHTPSDLPSN